MESNQFLGILLGKEQATVVHVDAGRGGEITDVFTVKPDPQADEPVSLVALLGETIAARALKFDEAAIALDSGFYSQYPLRSTFTDPRQLEGTVKYDAEEATACDAASLAVTFDIMSVDAGGSQLMIYSADRQSLTGILMDLQAQGIDPTVMEPDLVCLGRILERSADLHEHPDCLYVVLGRRSCAVFRSEPQQKSIRSRRFLIGAGECMNRELLQQIRLSVASWSHGEPMKKICIGGSLEAVDLDALAGQLPLPVEPFELEMPRPDSAEILSTDVADAAAAWGAALTLTARGRRADFRRDFMPYQGKKRILQACFRAISVSAALVLISVGVYFQVKTFRMQTYTSDLDKKLTAEFKAGMYGQNPPDKESVTSRLRREYTRVKKIQEGLGPGDEKSVTAKLTFILEAFNKSPKTVNMNIEQISITERSMRVLGDTNSRRSTMELLEEIKKHPKLKMETEAINPAPPRDKFIVTFGLAE